MLKCRAALCAIVVAVLTAVFAPGVALADVRVPAPRVADALEYVSLGDSYSSGRACRPISRPAPATARGAPTPPR